MSSIGETLRRERQKRNLDLEQVSRELKISTRFLEAIENEQFDRLPGGVFAKSFVRQYARVLDLDEEEAAAEVQRTLAPPSLAQLTETPSPAPGPVPDFAPRVDSISSRPVVSGSWLPALALVVAVMLGCSMVYGWWQREHRTVAAASPARTTHPVQQAVNPPAQPPQPAGQTASSQPEAAPGAPAAQSSPQPPAANAPDNNAERAADGKPAPTTPATGEDAATALTGTVHPAGPVKVVLTTADEPVWVLARSDGKYAFSGTIEPNQTRTVDATGIVLLRLGNAGGVTITVNGKPLPSPGPKGQVRTIQLTSGGFQIAAPPKPSATPDGL